MLRTCPNCEIELNPEEFRGFSLDVCRGCAGIWFDEGELRQIQKLGSIELLILEETWTPDVVQDDAVPGVFACPGCKGVLDRFNYLNRTGAEISCCRDCGGVWVEDGALKTFEQELAAKGKHEKSPTMISRELIVVEIGKWVALQRSQS